MPYKNDNLEELFQKAADDYPLRTNSSNWNSVATKLNIPVAEDISAKKSNAWKYAAILLFLLTGGALMFYTQFKSTNNVEVANDSTANIKNQKDLTNIQAEQIPNENSSISATNNSKPLASSKTNTALNNFGNANNYSSNNSENDYSMLKKDNDNDVKSKINSPAVNSSGELVLTPKQNQSSAPLIVNNNKQVEGNQNVINTKADNGYSSTEKSMIKYQKPLSKFYGSLYGGPEFSMIKFQHINAPGFKAGISLAYRINNRFDIQIGLEREKINYYTNGQYFDKSGLNIKDAVALESLSAKSSLTFVPVTLLYNFQSKNSGHFYAGLGFNALVLTHTEKYQYTVNKNGDENDHSKSYKSVTGPKYFTSINMSGGYENKLNNWCNFKVEPYYQVPVVNLGVGRLPVTNFGINIGIVKNLK